MDDRADWIRENLTTRHKWGINDFQEFYDRDVTYLLDQNAKLRAENERLKTEMAKDSENCFHAKRILEEQMSLMVKELEQLRAELAAERDEKTALMTVLQAEREANEATKRELESLLEPIHLGYFYNDEVGITDIYILDKDGNETSRPIKAKCLLKRISKYFERAKSAEQELVALKDRLEKAISEGWVGRNENDDTHWFFLSEPELDEENKEWWPASDSLGGELNLGDFDSHIHPGKSCRVKLVEVEG